MRAQLPNPKSKIRNPNELRSPKSEAADDYQGDELGRCSPLAIRRSSFAMLLLLSTLNLQLSTFAQGTAFTYQGRLNDGGAPANGTNYGMVFYLYDAPANGTALGNEGIVSVTVSNGLFTVPLDFGSQFDGHSRWLEITVQKNGGSFTTLSPRQPITPAPYAITAVNLSAVAENNNIHSGVASPTIGGGSNNIIQTGANFSTIGGGQNNTNSGSWATIGGGKFNTSSGFYSTVAGGFFNTARGAYSTVGGGYINTAIGPDSFAAGTQAQAVGDGSFVWADDHSFPFSDTVPNQFAVRATGGFRFVTGIDVSGNGIAGVRVAPGGTAWASISDRNAKKNFAPVNGEAVLEKLAALPVQFWNYKWESETDTPHLGPMAQDFKAAFYPGRDDKSISTLEFDGIELAAIQGLNRKVQDGNQRSEVRIQKLEAENAELKQKNDSLEKRLNALENIVRNQKSY